MWVASFRMISLSYWSILMTLPLLTLKENLVTSFDLRLCHSYTRRDAIDPAFSTSTSISALHSAQGTSVNGVAELQMKLRK